MNTRAPSSPLAVQEIRKMIDRLRGAQIAASVNNDAEWQALAAIIHPLQELHRAKTGRQY